MLLKHCKRCDKVIPYPMIYCMDCQEVVDAYRAEQLLKYKRVSNSNYNRKRDPKYLRFYRSVDWKMMSAKRLQESGYRCCMCGTIATEVDHIEPIQTAGGWEKRLDYDNTRAVCHICHDKIHNRFRRRVARGRGSTPYPIKSSESGSK